MTIEDQRLSSQLNNDVEMLIREIGKHQRPDDYSQFFSLLPGLSLFIRIAGQLPADVQVGKSFQTKAGDEIETFTASVRGLECIVVFTTDDNPRLGSNYLVIEGREALRTVLRLPHVGGLIVQSSGADWILLNKQKISQLVSDQR